MTLPHGTLPRETHEALTRLRTAIGDAITAEITRIFVRASANDLHEHDHAELIATMRQLLDAKLRLKWFVQDTDPAESAPPSVE